EMDNRYKMFADMGARNITDYNQKIKRRKDVDPLPYIVIIIDELADLMMLSPEETERGVTRLAQMARATGIHMVIATQRPSVDVVTGLIKANFPARIAFAVASSTDSRVILDTTGAERLLGQGDMLFQSPDAAAPRRLQGCFVSEPELAKLISYWQRARRFNYVSAEESVQARPAAALPVKPPTAVAAQPVPPPTINLDDDTPTRPNPAVREKETLVTAVEPPAAAIASKPEPEPEPPQPPLWEDLQKAQEEAVTQAQYEDELMPKAIALVRDLQKASTSLLQRRFRIGYTRAARMIDAMEEMGIIGPPTGTSKARQVLLPKENETEGEKASDA
ncbi:MAG: DNA translocase FtsK, partial [Anaerolineae bacterium]